MSLSVTTEHESAAIESGATDVPKAHPCRDGSVGRSRGTTFPCRRGIRRPAGRRLGKAESRGAGHIRGTRFPSTSPRGAPLRRTLRCRSCHSPPLLYFQSLFRNGSEVDLPRPRKPPSWSLKLFSRSSLVGTRKERKLARPVFRVSEALGSRATFGGYRGLETAGAFWEGVGIFTAVAGLF